MGFRSFTRASSEELNIASVGVAAYPFSAACWFFSDDLTVGQGLFGIGTSGALNNYLSLAAQGNVASDPVRAVYKWGGSQISAATSAGYSASTWHHAAAAWYDDGTQKSTVWLDGGNEGVASGSGGTANFGALDVTNIGSLNSNTNYMSGRICLMGCWSVQFTATDAAALYNGGNPLDPRMYRPDVLVGAWLCKQADGDVDYWGQADMTAINTPGYSAGPSGILMPSGVISIVPAAPAPPVAGDSTNLTILGVG